MLNITRGWINKKIKVKNKKSYFTCITGFFFRYFAILLVSSRLAGLMRWSDKKSSCKRQNWRVFSFAGKGRATELKKSSLSSTLWMLFFCILLWKKITHQQPKKTRKERKKEEFPSNPFLLLLLLAIDEMDSQQGDIRRPRVALLYDERMCKHWNPNDDDHPETPDRIRAIWKLLESRGIPQRSPLLLLVIFSREISYRGLVWMRRTRGGENILWQMAVFIFFFSSKQALLQDPDRSAAKPARTQTHTRKKKP